MSHPPPALSDPERQGRAAVAVGTVVVALWSFQVWRPSLSYPFQGISSTLLLALLAVAACWLTFRSGPGGRSESAGAGGAGWAGAAFLCYVWLRWAATGFAAVGDENVLTLLGTGLWAVTAFYLGAACRSRATVASASARLIPLLTVVYGALAAVALVCGIHAVLQYFYLYDRTLEELQRSLGTTPPTPLQEGIIHHLKLKRVASVWGDPNALAGFAALSLAPAAWCAGGWNKDGGAAGRALAVLGWCAIPSALAAIVFSGSRGGVLDLLLVIGLTLLLRRGKGKRPQTAPAAAVAAGIAVLLAAQSPLRAQPRPQPVENVSSSPLPAFFSRIDTVRERLHYMRVGSKIFGQNPFFGSGPGAVDLYYGRYRPVEARESKFLHNWPLQIAAELGSVGLALAVAFVVFLFRPLRWRLAVRDPALRPLLIVAAVFVGDALLQLSFNQRELMALFGLCSGLLLSAGPEPRSRPTGPLRFAGRAFVGFLIAATLLHGVPSLMSSAWRQAAQTALEDGDPAAAVRYLRRAVSWAPRDPDPLLTLGLVQAQLLGPQAGAHFVEKALKLQPESANLHAQLARLRLQGGRPGEAVNLARQALELYPHNAEHHLLLSEIQQARGDLPAALESAREALRTGYRRPEVYEKRVRELQTAIR